MKKRISAPERNAILSTAIVYLRFSTDGQSFGTSTERQTEFATKWCRDNRARLVKTYKDEGISGGKNSDGRKGLRDLLADLKRGNVPQYLLCEDVDRLSRMLPMDSLNLIQDILASGITLVSIRDGQMLTKDSWQGSQSFLILTLKTTLANEERQKRIIRGKFSWKSKRASAKTKLITKKIPSWLKLDGEKIKVIPEHKKTIQLMFKLAMEGYGIVSIIRHFNENGVKSFRGKDWNKAIVHNTLTGIQVLGHCQPKTNVDGKRVADGELLTDYFPRVISDEVFYSVQGKLKQRNKYKGAGFRYTRKPGQNNLFAGVIKCEKCGASLIHLVRSRHGYSYLVCGNAHKHKSCDYKTIATNLLEELFRQFLTRVAVFNTFQAPIPNKAAATRIQIETTKKQLGRLVKMIEDGEGAAPKSVLKRITELEDKQTELEQSLNQRIAEDINESQQHEKYEEFCEHMEKSLRDVQGRVKIASLIKDLFESIVVNPEKCTMRVNWKNYGRPGCGIWEPSENVLQWDKETKEAWHVLSNGEPDRSKDIYSLFSLDRKNAKAA